MYTPENNYYRFQYNPGFRQAFLHSFFKANKIQYVTKYNYQDSRTDYIFLILQMISRNQETGK
jgi:hypothetical protein